jgi:hypothetical protein
MPNFATLKIDQDPRNPAIARLLLEQTRTIQCHQ